MPYNKANMGYIPAIVVKELSVGHKVEIVGAVYININSNDDYHRRKNELTGLFGEIISWRKDGVTQIATRCISDCPPWVREMIDQFAWDHPMMFRWKVPKEER